MAFELAPLAPNASALALAVAIDLAVGDPVYGGHPVRLIGRTLQQLESALRRVSADGYAGGIALFVGLSAVWVLGLSLAVASLSSLSVIAGWFAHLFLLYSFLALGDLLHHGWRIERALRRGHRDEARLAVSQLVGRDTDRLDEGGCRRAAIESLSENLTDGFISPLCWYVAAGIPGLALFKVVSTMDSMVGYKSERYLRFGWCGARLDDVMNFVPARLSWLVIGAVAAVLPGFSGRKAWTVGLQQHGILLGPNSGWSEAATAGALERRIVGPIWLNGALVTDAWIGDQADPELATAQDVRRAIFLSVVAGLAVVVGGIFVILAVQG